MPEIFQLPLDAIQPSQLFINEEKLARVMCAVGKDGAIEPLPVKKLGDHIVYSDGHTRALAAWLRRERVIDVYWETDELSWDAYAVCVEWCRAHGIHSIADLRYSVIPAALYQTAWLDRCARLRYDDVQPLWAEQCLRRDGF